MASKSTKSRGLGRGLSALMADVNSDQSGPIGNDITRQLDMVVPIEKVAPNPDQPRRIFAQDKLDDLANSIKEKGIIQPLIVRKMSGKNTQYQIVAGERRWRAAQLANLHEIPVMVREFNDTEVLEIAIIENIQRAELNPVEEAQGYRQLIEKFGHTQEKTARALGKSRSHIANQMRLLQLPSAVLDFLEQGKLSAGHARALITASDPSALAQMIIKNGLSVRDTEKLVKKATVKDASKPSIRTRKNTVLKDADTIALEGDLSANLRMKVEISHNSGQEDGQMVIRYKSLDDLDELCRLLARS